ncbi:type II secretion system protein GspM [Bordetella avium]|uniref:type II secretion system protein GspM n=1 Tax=Bordetella avium TaxID=521 RepID=UPI000E6991F1|nr:type II secretion system protein GspM [Bordetella avium]RIQ18739.1 type II secretion system protein M [Bordetella avium]RIQ35226.1 type II secretion system protein M [Bordetella avium]RIQ72066.1 type II secretion system protein M [Bordetella avium]
MKRLTQYWLKLSQYAAPQLHTLRARHAALSLRERRLLLAVSAILAAAVIFLGFIEPPLAKLARLRTDLPSLRIQAAAVDDLAARASALSRRAQVRAELPTPSDLRGSLIHAGLPADHWTLTQEDAVYVLTLNDVPAQRLLDWLETSARDWGLLARQAELARALNPNGRPLPGLVNASLRLALTQGN